MQKPTDGPTPEKSALDSQRRLSINSQRQSLELGRRLLSKQLSLQLEKGKTEEHAEEVVMAQLTKSQSCTSTIQKDIVFQRNRTNSRLKERIRQRSIDSSNPRRKNPLVESDLGGGQISNQLDVIIHEFITKR